jgi:hypothetical protein
MSLELADGVHGGSEDGFEVGFEVGVFFEDGLDGLLGDGAGVSEVDEGGEGVLAGGADGDVFGVGGVGCGHIVELVLELEDDALGGLFADAGDAGEHAEVVGADGADEALGGDAGEDGDGELGADAGDGDKLFEEALLLRGGEAEEGDLVFADVGVDVEGGLGAFGWEFGEGGDGDVDVVAYAGAVDDGLVGRFGEELAAEVSDHLVIVLGVSRRINGRPGVVVARSRKRFYV